MGRRLNDLKRKRQVIRPRNARHITLDYGVEGQPVCLVRLLLSPGRGGVGNLSTAHNTQARRYCADGSEFHHGAEICGMGFDIPICTAQRLPDAIEVRVAVGGTGNRGLGRDLQAEAKQEYHYGTC